MPHPGDRPDINVRAYGTSPAGAFALSPTVDRRAKKIIAQNFISIVTTFCVVTRMRGNALTVKNASSGWYNRLARFQLRRVKMGTRAGRSRKSIRLTGYNYTQAGGYFVTIVTFQRECLFGEIASGEVRLNALGRIVTECWHAIPEHFPNAEVDAFVVMPNHVHGIVFLAGATHVGALHATPLQIPHGPPAGSLGTIVRSFKSAVVRRAGIELNSGNVWQRNYYEHIIRNQVEHERIAMYILENPSNWEQDEERPR
jgi:REP-associated tyrosine transposase